MLARTRNLAVSMDNLLITHSIERAIDVVARALIAPGDIVAVEAWGYPPAWNLLRLAGARLLPIALDEHGLDVAALERVLEREPLRAVFLTPHHQFPTAVVMSPARRARLAELALRHRFLIIEDDYDHEFHYHGKPVLPLAAGAGRANVVYLGSLANLLAPGVHTAFITAPAPAFRRLAALRAASEPRADAAIECALAELFEDGELLRHMRRARRLYESRRDALAEALRRQLGSALEFRVPEGGLALWARADEAVDLAAWMRAGETEGVRFTDARRFDFHQRDASALRLGYGFHDEAELGEAVRRMARALKNTLRRRDQTRAAA
jgi:GntR family transcriptional regulator/MocR family aminotransferase